MNEELKELLENSAREIKMSGEVRIKSPQQKEAEKEFEEWKNEKVTYKPIKEFKIPHELLKVIQTTKQHNGLIFNGEGGIGKTLLTISSIKNTLKPNEWAYSRGYTTALSLYGFLYKNREKKILILDDLEGVFNNPLSLSILKGALWDSDGKRICQYSSTSEKAEYPSNFIMKAKIVILCNSIPNENDISTRATLSRTILYKINFTFKEKMKMCEGFIKKDNTLTDKQKTKVIYLLNKHITPATKDFNFRTLKKIIAFVQYNINKAEELLKATTEQDELKEAYLKSIKKSKEVKTQILYFIELTGKSRATFFRIKKKFVKK